MIISMTQARQVQERRVKAGKRGYAKAVRRYLQSRSGVFDYKLEKASLPCAWPDKAVNK